MPELHLTEWQEAYPDSAPVLRGRLLDTLEQRAAAERWRFAVRIDETRTGLRIRAKQHVGVVRLGDLRICIRPKLPVATLWPLVAYGLGLDHVPRRPPVDMALTGDMPELLGAMLLAESRALLRSGLARGYRAHDAWLETPRGRLDMNELSRNLPLSRAALPCRHHPYTADILCNRVVASGLQLASRGIRSPRLRSALHAAATQWQRECEPAVLTPALLDAADRDRSRLQQRYAPTHALVRAFFEKSGPADDLQSGPDLLHGALWNMATLFERAVARYLSEHLPAPWVVDTQHRLRRLYSVMQGPHAHNAPVPRPDLVVRSGTQAVAVLDTKYRDLSTTALPPHMLYQMSVYSLAFGGDQPIPAVVLYALPSGAREDVRITLHVEHGLDRTLVLRAVPLDRLVASLGTGGESEEAQRWLLGKATRNTHVVRHTSAPSA